MCGLSFSLNQVAVRKLKDIFTESAFFRGFPFTDILLVNKYIMENICYISNHDYLNFVLRIHRIMNMTKWQCSPWCYWIDITLLSTTCSNVLCKLRWVLLDDITYHLALTSYIVHIHTCLYLLYNEYGMHPSNEIVYLWSSIIKTWRVNSYTNSAKKTYTNIINMTNVAKHKYINLYSWHVIL